MFLGWCRKPYSDELLYGYICSVFRQNGYRDMAQINESIEDGKIGANYAIGLPFIRDKIENSMFPSIEQMLKMLPICSYKDSECALQPEKACFPVPKKNREIRICPECMKIDKQQYGEVILHLSHHQKSRYCPIHGCILHWAPAPAATRVIIPFEEYIYLAYETVSEPEKKSENFHAKYISSTCNKCGKQYFEREESRRRGVGCPYCNKIASSDYIINRMLLSMYKGEYRLQSGFASIRSACVVHVPCNTTSTKLENLLNGKQTECKECSKLLPKYLQRKYDPDKDNWIFLPTSDEDRAKRRIRVKHTVCGQENNIFMSQYTSKEGGYCPLCDNPQERKEISNVDPEYEVISDYHNNREPIRIKHKKCGIEFDIIKTSFLAGARCPICTPHYSYTDVESAITACCPGWKVRQNDKRGSVTLTSPTGVVYGRCSYGSIMADLRSTSSVIFPEKAKLWVDPVSIRKRIYDRISEETEKKGYWSFADGLDDITDSRMPGGISRERRNIIQDMAKKGFIERCGNGKYITKAVKNDASILLSDSRR